MYDDLAAPEKVENAIPTVINYLMIAVGIVAVVIIIYSAFLMVTATGDPEKFKNGRQALTAGIIGLLIAVLGAIIVQIVINSVGM